MCNVKKKIQINSGVICKHRWSPEDALGFMIETIRERNETKNA